MKLSDGKMRNAPGMMVHYAQIPAEFLKEDQKLTVFVPCKEVHGKWDLTRGVSMHVTFLQQRPRDVCVI